MEHVATERVRRARLPPRRAPNGSGGGGETDWRGYAFIFVFVAVGSLVIMLGVAAAWGALPNEGDGAFGRGRRGAGVERALLGRADPCADPAGYFCGGWTPRHGDFWAPLAAPPAGAADVCAWGANDTAAGWPAWWPPTPQLAALRAPLGAVAPDAHPDVELVRAVFGAAPSLAAMRGDAASNTDAARQSTLARVAMRVAAPDCMAYLTGVGSGAPLEEAVADEVADEVGERIRALAPDLDPVAALARPGRGLPAALAHPAVAETGATLPRRGAAPGRGGRAVCRNDGPRDVSARHGPGAVRRRRRGGHGRGARVRRALWRAAHCVIIDKGACMDQGRTRAMIVLV
jgi:hypothetical protein